MMQPPRFSAYSVIEVFPGPPTLCRSSRTMLFSARAFGGAYEVTFALSLMFVAIRSQEHARNLDAAVYKMMSQCLTIHVRHPEIDDKAFRTNGEQRSGKLLSQCVGLDTKTVFWRPSSSATFQNWPG
jgi:hypothetical protein